MNAVTRLKATAVNAAMTETIGSLNDTFHGSIDDARNLTASIAEDLGFRGLVKEQTLRGAGTALLVLHDAGTALEILEMVLEVGGDDEDAGDNEYVSVQTGGKLVVAAGSTKEAARVAAVVTKRLKSKLVTVTAKGKSVVIAPAK